MTVAGAAAEPTRADLRRVQILEAAHKCFSREGFDAATMASIAAEAQLSVGQIYRYFENKEAVIEALCERHLEEWTRRMEEVRARTGDAVEEILEIARFNAEKLDESGGVSLILEFFAEAARNPRIGGVVCRVDAAIRNKLRELMQRRGDLSAAEIDARVMLVCVLIDGWLLRVVKDPTASKDEYLGALRPVFSAVLAR